MTPHDKIQLGLSARYLANDPTFKAAVARAEADLWSRWKAASTVAEREELHAETRALQRVVSALHAIDTDGTVAQSRI